MKTKNIKRPFATLLWVSVAFLAVGFVEWTVQIAPALQSNALYNPLPLPDQPYKQHDEGHVDAPHNSAEQSRSTATVRQHIPPSEGTTIRSSSLRTYTRCGNLRCVRILRRLK